MRLVEIAKLLLERIGVAVIDIQVNKVDLIAVFSLQPVHDGRQRAAGRSPEGEKFDQLGFSRRQRHAAWVARMQLSPRGRLDNRLGRWISALCRRRDRCRLTLDHSRLTLIRFCRSGFC
jgi:hypothetical protein